MVVETPGWSTETGKTLTDAQGKTRSRMRSIPRAAGGAREGDGVAYISDAGDVGEGALEAEAEAGVRHRAVAAQAALARARGPNREIRINLLIFHDSGFKNSGIKSVSK
jgi:hypothetical protein